MTTYFADSNIFIRYIVQDNIKLADQSEEYFIQAKNKTIKMIFLSEIVLEIEYVLRKVYLFTREELIRSLSSLVKMSYLEIEDRKIFMHAILLFQQKSVDLIDIFLLLKAKEGNAQVLSYDRDFQKFKNKLKQP